MAEGTYDSAAELHEKLKPLVGDAILHSERGAVLDLDLFTRMMANRAIPFNILDRDAVLNELLILRDEVEIQETIAENSRPTDGLPVEEAEARLGGLRAREKQILDLLWPVA